MDLGFQVFNLTTYPHFVGMLQELEIETEMSDMSFSLSLDGGKFEWSSDAVFGQATNALSPSFLRMLYDVLRFGREAPAVLHPTTASRYRDVTLGQYLTSKGYSQTFISKYVLPMCAAVWSVPVATCLEFPVTTLVQFWVNHHLLDVFERPLWRVISNRAEKYVEKIINVLPDVRLGAQVTVVRRGKHPKITLSNGLNESFDAVVLVRGFVMIR